MSSSVIKRTLSLASGDTTSRWYRLQGTAQADKRRAIHGTLTSGDSITIQVTNDDLSTDRTVMDMDGNTAPTRVFSSDAFTTTSFGTILNGGWAWIKVIKSGSNGAASINIEGA